MGPFYRLAETEGYHPAGHRDPGSALLHLAYECTPPNTCLQSDGRPALRFDKSRPRPDVDRWTARPLGPVWRPPLKHDPLAGLTGGSISDKAAWVQAIAALASVGVTIWLARLTARYVRVTEEISRATTESVKQALTLAKASDEAAGNVLLIEAKRIRAELGPAPTGTEIAAFRTDRVAPAVHPWIHGTIPAAARLHPAVVDKFMRLNSCLDDHRASERTLRDAEGELASAEHWSKAGSGGAELSAQIANELRAKQRLDAAAAAATAARQQATATYRQCHEILEGIIDLLAPFEGRILPG